MPFSSFKAVDEVAIDYQIAVEYGDFVDLKPAAVDAHFAEEMRFNQKNLPPRASEAAVCESLIYPVLREAWKPFLDHFLLWSHEPLGEENPLAGIADYFFTLRSPQGLIPVRPVVIVVEAKKDDFETGWGQCLAAMIAAQKVNRAEQDTLFGCTASRRVWTFGKLVGNTLILDQQDVLMRDLPGVLGAWHSVFSQALAQIGQRGLKAI